MKYLILTLSLFITIKIHSQVAIEVAEQILRIGGGKEEEIYLGFAEGDKVIFNSREVNDKDVKEIEIIEYPDNSKFSDFKTSKIDNKTFRQLGFFGRFDDLEPMGMLFNYSL